MVARGGRVPAAELSEPELAAWGAAFARTLPLPACVTLSGELGAGKTTLVRAIAVALGVAEPVTSPTYALVHEYATALAPVIHVDLYRLEDALQLPQLGWDDLLRSHAVLLVEWPERAAGALPARRIALTLEHVPGRPAVRRLTWPA